MTFVIAMKQNFAPVRRHAARMTTATYTVVLLGALTLAGCANMDTHRVLPTKWQQVERASKTVVYVKPKSDMGMADIPSWGQVMLKGLPTAVIVGTATGLTRGIMVIPYPSKIKGYDNFLAHIKPHLPEISKLNLSQYGELMVGKVTSAVPWLKDAPQETVPPSEKQGYLQNIAVRNPTRVTFFIIPRGAQLGSDAKKIYVTYTVVTYIKEPNDPENTSLLESTTLQTVQPIAFPENIENYNPLISPTTNALADRINMLFADNDDYFMKYFKMAIQAEQDKITHYFMQGHSQNW